MRGKKGGISIGSQIDTTHAKLQQHAAVFLMLPAWFWISPAAPTQPKSKETCKCKRLTVTYLNASRLASKKKSLPQAPSAPAQLSELYRFANLCGDVVRLLSVKWPRPIKQQWREWLIQQWRWQYSSASIWRQPAGLEPFQTALCFSSEEKSIHNWWQFKGRLYCGISNKTSENTENKRGR